MLLVRRGQKVTQETLVLKDLKVFKARPELPEQLEQPGHKDLKATLAIQVRKALRVQLERLVLKALREILETQVRKVQQALKGLQVRKVLQDLKDHLELLLQAHRWFTTQAHKL